MHNKIKYQINEYLNRLVFLGDDTWDSLFPTQFHVNLPFDSFNTKVKIGDKHCV